MVARAAGVRRRVAPAAVVLGGGPMADWRNRIAGSGEESPDQLLANPRNFRRHPKHQQDALRGVLAEVGWVQDVIVNRTTGHLVDGHLRVELAMRTPKAFRARSARMTSTVPTSMSTKRTAIAATISTKRKT